nr:receptor-like protein 12 [Ipomoea batatas]
MHALGHCLPDQKSVLLQIRSEITYNSSESTKLALWDEGGDCCRWPGLSCNAATGFITSLDLSDDKSITGGFNVSLLSKLPSLSVIRLDWVQFSAPFPDFFKDFTNLTVLSLSNCNFSGTVPHKVFQLSKLVELSLSENLFSGPIPASLFFLPSLQTLSLWGNKLSGHITELRNVTSPLESLDLSGNNLEGTIPSFFFRLQNLTSLDLSSNKFLGQMIDLQNVTSPLESLDLSRNNLEGTIPSFFFRLQSLTSLDLSSNKFFGQMIDLQNVTSPLQILDLSSNDFEGTIPLFFFQLQSLTSLYLSSNKFFGPPIDLQNVTSPLQILDLRDNNLEGTIPSFFFRLQSLTSLDLSSNKFFGQMIDLQNVTSPLQSLQLSSNDFEGTIPPFLFQLQNLTMLDLSSNKFNSIAPLTKFKSQYLDILDFSNNNLVETTISTSELPLLPQFGVLNLASCNLQKIPGFLKSQSKLRWLDLSNNTINGEIPNWIWGIGNGQLSGLHLSHNRLTHMKEPMEYGSLHFLDLNSNMLSGPIPRPPPEALYLDFSNNNFSMIPLDIADQIPDVFFFSIAKNRVSGKISTSCGHLPTDLFLALKAILVERNELNSKADCLHFTSYQGVVDIYYQDSIILSLKGQTYAIEKVLSIFTSIDFSSNQFEGSIPESVGELKQLYLLNISHNALTGNIPPSLQNLKALEALDLSFNNLTGNIPVQLEILTFLEILNLSYNHLVGRIPRSTQLDTFDASSFMGNKGLCGFQINVSCSGIDEPTSPIPESEENESTHHVDIYISVAFGFAAGLGGIFVPLLLSGKWRSYYNKMIDGILSKIFFQRGQERRKKSR